MSSNISILFIDDEGFWARPYRDRLTEEFGEIVFCDDASEGLDYFGKTLGIDIVLLDVMMPTPDSVDPFDTDNGLDTGLWLLGQIKSELIGRRVPIIMLTNRNRATVEERVRKLGFPEGLIEIRLKSETPAFFLPSRVKMLVTHWRK